MGSDDIEILIQKQNLQSPMPTTQSTHGLGLDAGHPHEILRVGQVGG